MTEKRLIDRTTFNWFVTGRYRQACARCVCDCSAPRGFNPPDDCPLWTSLEKAPVSRVVPPDPKRGEVGPQIVTDLFEGKEPENDQKAD